MIMASDFSLDKIFYEQLNEEMTSLGYKYVRKNKMFMKVSNDIIVKYVYLKTFSKINSKVSRFMIEGNLRSLYADSFIRNDLLVESMSNSRYNDIVHGPDNGYPKYYECGYEEADKTVRQAFADSKEGIIREIENVNSFEKYIRYCQKYNHGQISCATKYWKDSLALIVANDHVDMKERLNETIKTYEDNQHIDYIEKVYPLLYRSFVELVAGERDKVYNDPVLYKEALEEAERRKEANTLVLKDLKLI